MRIEHLRKLVLSRTFERVTVAVILGNALTLGLEATPVAMEKWGSTLIALDRAALAFFIVEIISKIVLLGRQYLRSGWNIFDVIIVALTAFPIFHELSVLRILRLLRVFSLVPQFRVVIGGFFRSVKALLPVAGVLLTIMYIFSVVTTKLFGPIAPEYFGSTAVSMLTMFQTMTLEGWIDTSATVSQTYPWAPLVFVAYILLTTFTVLNLLIGVVVNAMQEVSEEVREEERRSDEKIRARLDELGQELRDISKHLGDGDTPRTGKEKA